MAGQGAERILQSWQILVVILHTGSLNVLVHYIPILLAGVAVRLGAARLAYLSLYCGIPEVYCCPSSRRAERPNGYV